MFSFLVLASLIGYAVGGGSSKIVNGTVVDIKDYPYQLAMLYEDYPICGASIISAQWALTAAHCLRGFDNSSFSFRAGSNEANSGGQVVEAVSIVVHPKYNTTRRLIYDFALAKVSPNFNLGQPGIDIIRIGMITPKPGVSTTVSGWGHTSFHGTASPILLAANVIVVDQSDCNTTYGGRIAVPMLCAYENGQNACQGDSGGPLVIRDPFKNSAIVQVGVVSFGYRCVYPNVPSVYANPANARLWIRRVSGV